MEDYNMAYKFQLGAARLSGSVTQEGNITAESSQVSASTIALSDAGGIVETGGGLANADGKLELSMDQMDSVAFDVAQDKIFFSAVGNAGGNIRSGSLADLATGMAGTALNASSGQINVANVANAQIDNNAAISLTKLATVAGGSFILGNAANQAAAQTLSGDVSSVSNGGVVTLAAAQTNITSIINSGIQAIGTAADQEAIDFTTSNEVSINVNGTSMLTVTSTAVEIAGNLTVEGTTTTIESNTLLVKDKTIELNVITGSEARTSNSGAGLYLSGSTAANDCSLLLTADGGRFKASGSSAGFDVQTGGDYRINGVSILSATALASSVIVDGDSLDIAGCASTLDSSTIADADLFIVDDNAASDPKKITAGNLKTFFQSGVTATSTNGFALNTYGTGSAAQSLGGNSGVWIVNTANAEAGNAVTLHLSGTWSNGNVVIVKAPANADSNNLTIAASGSQLIDGHSTLTLESSHAAVSLVYGDNDNWFIF
jgi:hypothetical protein|tara:strand:+ start:414 stop:1880 length:1467 start_codon:yes stop_codon:yes gene_type:complete